VRAPTSAPLLRTNGVAGSTGSPVFGSFLMVTPRASLLWKPSRSLQTAPDSYAERLTFDPMAELVMTRRLEPDDARLSPSGAIAPTQMPNSGGQSSTNVHVGRVQLFGT